MMNIAISGTYQHGKVILNEIPPVDASTDVMVVFLPNNSTKSNAQTKPQNHQAQEKTNGSNNSWFGKFSDDTTDFDAIANDLKQLSRQTESNYLNSMDTK